MVKAIGAIIITRTGHPTFAAAMPGIIVPHPGQAGPP